MWLEKWQAPKGFCYSDQKTAELLECTPEERPMAVQLFGEDPEFMARAVEKVMPYAPDIIDINMGVSGSESGGSAPECSDERPGACRRNC